ncbi:MAG: Gfo/Idh/MocA family oxidoreductase [Bacteroidota bacterium]
MNKQKIKTLVCGSTFGQFYLEALKRLSDDFEIVGILSQGSERSKKCAQYYDLPMFESIDQLPPDIDLACVVLRSAVMGGQGTNLSLQLLEKRIHVIQEHPVHQDDISKCIKKARQQGVSFMTGDLFIHLPAIKHFATCAKLLFEQQEAVYIDMAFATQVSFPLIHILLETLPSLRPFKINQVIKDEGPFQLVAGILGKIPFTMRAHNEVNPDDPDNYLHLLHSIIIGFAGGNLSLTDTHGPVIWRPRLHVPHNKMLGKLTSQENAELSSSSSTILGSATHPTYIDILKHQWPQAIGQDLKKMQAFITQNERMENRGQQELLCARQWKELTSAIGYPQLRPDAAFRSMDITMLQEQALKISAGMEEQLVPQP